MENADNNERTISQDNRIETAKETYSLLIMISTPKKVEEMANFALANGAVGAFFSFARGTIPNHILAMLGLASVKREMAVLAVPNCIASSLLENVNHHFNLAEKLEGIAYLISLEKTAMPSEIESEHTYSVITTIVNEGEGEEVVEHVRRNHQVGATILNASGSADHSRKTFNFEIIPSKEIVLMVTKKNLCKDIYRIIHDALRTELPGRGVIFSTDIDGVAGIREKDFKHERARTGDDFNPNHRTPLERPPEVRFTSAVNDAAKHQIAVLVLVDRGHTGEIIRLAETAGSLGATIIRGRFTQYEHRGFLSHAGDAGKEAIIMVTAQETARAILRQLRQYAATHTDLHILSTWMRIHSFSRFSYGNDFYEINTI